MSFLLQEEVALTLTPDGEGITLNRKWLATVGETGGQSEMWGPLWPTMPLECMQSTVRVAGCDCLNHI